MKRWRWIAASTLIAVVAWIGTAEAGPTKLYVADEESNSVSVIDGGSRARIAGSLPSQVHSRFTLALCGPSSNHW